MLMKKKKALMRASAMKSKFPSFLPQFPSHPSELNLQMSYISFQKPLSANKCLSSKKKKKMASCLFRHAPRGFFLFRITVYQICRP